MTTLVWLLMLPAVLAAAALILYVARYVRLRGTRVVTCPETGKAVAVELNAAHAARTSILSAPDFTLTDCTRWPEREGCDQECLGEVEQNPDACLPYTILARWYAGRTCIHCRREFGDVRRSDQKPALWGPDRSILDWPDVPPEQIREVLKSHRPICWNCALAESFRRAHPDLVVERPWREAGERNGEAH